MSFLPRLIGLLALTSIGVTAQVSFPGPELVGRPTDHSVTFNVVANAATEAYFEYSTTSGGPYSTFPGLGAANPISTAANTPLVVVLKGLDPDTRYFYRMVYRQTGTTSWVTRPEHSFRTQRPPSSTFTFTITSDSHLNIVFGNSSLFQQTLQNISDESPDFHLDLGDTFAMDNVTTQAQANSSYLNLRPYFGIISHSAPVFLALGNHEQPEGWHLNDTGNPAISPLIMSTNARKRYYLNPDPLLDAFYSGNMDTATAALNGNHSIQDYYAWQWGDALFVAIDPYWYSTTKPFIGNQGGGEPGIGSGDRWDWTLGVDQYFWLKQTLENSTAKYKFIFAHQVPGGTSDYGRGGANAAPYVEMGGFNIDGTTYAFNPRRPSFPMPVHQLLVNNHVTVFFHGHDHVFAYEKRDGVVYQEVPMAADNTYGLGFGEYHETDPYTIRVLPNSGHIRVTVSPSEATVDYVRAFLPGAGINGQVAYSYTLAPPLSITSPASLPDGVVGAPYAGAAFSASGGSGGYSWSATGLPGGLTISSNGSLNGTPAVGSQGSYTPRFTVTDSSGATASVTLALTVNPAPPPGITSISPNPVVAAVGTQTIFVNGTGFQSGAGLKVHLSNGAFQTDLTDNQVTFFSSTQLSIRADVGTSTANWTATVINPDNQSSNVFAFTVQAAQVTTYAVPQFVFGGGWYTALYFANTTDAVAHIQVNFLGNDGTPLIVPLLGIGSVSSQSIDVNPRSTVILEAPSGGTNQEGWAEVSVPTGVTGYAVFRQTVAGRSDQEAAVPFTPESSLAADLTYDDTQFTTAVAFLNPTATAETVTIATFDANGASTGSAQVVLAARSKTANVLKNIAGLSGIVGNRGRAVFSVTSGAVSVLGLRFGGSAFTSIPVVHRLATPETQTISFALPQFVYSGGWYTALYFSNTTDAPVSVPASFIGDDGAALPAPLAGIGTVASHTVLLNPGATGILEAPADEGTSIEGWVDAALPPGVTGYAVFRQTVSGRSDQEAVVPLTSESSQAADLVYDDIQFTTAVAFLNPSDQQTTVTITVYSANGAQLGSTQVGLAPHTKVATVLKNLPGLSSMAGNRGWAAFSVPNGDVSVLGLRFGGSAFTSIPVNQR